MNENNTQAPGPPSANQQNNEITSETHDYAAAMLEAEWVECYQAEMPYLVRYLMQCFNEANIDDAADAARRWTGTPLDRQRTSHLARLELGLAA